MPNFRAGRAHADDFLGAEVGADEGESADPGRDGAAGEEEVVGGAHVALEGEADAEDEAEIDQHDEPVDIGEVGDVHFGLSLGALAVRQISYEFLRATVNVWAG